MNKHTKRKQRRQKKMVLKSGGKFKVNHKGKSGRTGKMFSTYLKSLRQPKLTKTGAF